MILLRLARHLVSSVALILLACSCALAQSQPALRDPADATSRKSNQTPPQPSINVTVVAPEPSPEQAAQEEQYRQREVVAQEDVRDFTRWLTYLTFIQAFIGFAGFLIAALALKAANKNAIAAAKQAELSRQQLVGTLGAVVDARPELSPIRSLAIYFMNDGGVTARDVRTRISISRTTVPTLARLEEVGVYAPEYVAIPSKGAEAFKMDLDTAWYPIGKDSREDMWLSFTNKPETIRIEVSLSYNNGFGDRVDGQPVSVVYLPAWTIKTKRGSSGGGGLVPTHMVQFTWEEVRRRKDEEARGMYRD